MEFTCNDESIRFISGTAYFEDGTPVLEKECCGQSMNMVIGRTSSMWYCSLCGLWCPLDEEK